MKKNQINDVKIDDYEILDTESIRSALIKINDNKKGFLVVENSRGEVLGTVTDGDIRRELVKGTELEASIENCYKRDYVHVNSNDDFSYVLDAFKDYGIKFIPVIGEDKKLVNVITKDGLHSLLLQDVKLDLNLDFLSADNTVIDHEIYKRPWGFYRTNILNDLFQSKIISVDPEASLSLQEHKKREEHWIIIKGDGRVRLGDSNIHVSSGSYLFIPKGCKHRITNMSKTETLILAEVQLGKYFGEDDIIRFEDEYGRT